MGLKAAIIKRLAPYQYPQLLFAKAIIERIPRTEQQLYIADCPCGNGEVAYHLSAAKHVSVTAVDIDVRSIATASHNFRRPNLQFKAADIFEFLSEKKAFDLICVVNSLFLLPDQEKLFKLLHGSLNGDAARLIIITPNPEGKNFKRFQEQHPGVNKNVLGKNALKEKASEMQFAISEITELEYAGYYGRRELRLLSVFAPFYLQILNFFAKLSRQKQGNYILYSLKKL